MITITVRGRKFMVVDEPFVAGPDVPTLYDENGRYAGALMPKAGGPWILDPPADWQASDIREAIRLIMKEENTP